jgi:hypothetical protein
VVEHVLRTGKVETEVPLGASVVDTGVIGVRHACP